VELFLRRIFILGLTSVLPLDSKPVSELNSFKEEMKFQESHSDPS
jgi:hypothetical protein